MIAANLPLAVQWVNHTNVMGAMLSPNSSSSWTSEAQIQDPLPLGVVWRRLEIICLAPQLLPGVMGPGFRQDDAECLEAATPHTMPSATTM
ncbi:hypothetical protein ABIB85_000691 [Bradyrhizobium sp. JR1.5]